MDESHWNNSFVNQTRLSLLCEKSEAIVVSGSYSRQSDKILVDLKFSTDHIVRIFMAFNESSYSVIIVLLISVGKVYCEVCYGDM